MKKLLAVLLSVALLMSICGAVAEGEEPTKLVFWTFQEAHEPFYKEMEASWNANPDNPKIELDILVYPFDDMHAKLTVALDTGEGAPDIVDIEIGKFANYLKGEIQLEPINDLIEPVQDKFVMARFNNYAKDGKYYGIDHHIGACVMFYNVELLESAGIDYTTIKTWDDFHEAGKVLLEKTGKPMTTWESTDCWSLYPLVNQHGGDWLTKDNEVIMDSDVVISTLAFMKSMLDDGTAVAAPGGSHHAEEYWGAMNGGAYAAVSMPFWYLDRFPGHMPDLAGKMKIAPLPLWPDGGHKSAQMGGTGTSAVKTGAHVELAKQFMNYAFLSREGCIKSWTVLGFDPIMTEVYDAPEMLEPNAFFEYYDYEIFNVLKSVLDDIPDTNITDWYPTATDIVKEKMAYELVITGGDPEEIAKGCAEELRNKMAD